jgi:[ribosomal protein S5]-alanine N-acetyltransferase
VNTPPLQTKNLELVPQTIEEVRTMIEGMNPEQQKELSAEWLALFLQSTSPDQWVHGFTCVLRATGQVVGKGGFKGPPSEDGMVEIAYGIEPEYQGKGYATEAAEALTQFAFSTGQVQIVRAHTLPSGRASQRVLTKCGFQKFGEIIDPEDGLVWRWEKRFFVPSKPSVPHFTLL